MQLMIICKDGELFFGDKVRRGFCSDLLPLGIDALLKKRGQGLINVTVLVLSSDFNRSRQRGVTGCNGRSIALSRFSKNLGIGTGMTVQRSDINTDFFSEMMPPEDRPMD